MSATRGAGGQRRRHFRLDDVTRDIDIVFRYWMDRGEILDVSEGGLSCVARLRDDPGPGDRAKLHFSLADEDFAVDAVVVRATWKLGATWEVAFSFVDQTPKEEDRLRGAVYAEQRRRLAARREGA